MNGSAAFSLYKSQRLPRIASNLPFNPYEVKMGT